MTDDWDADAYDDAHGFVFEYGADVLDLLDPSPGERVLDLGCGTGHLTDRIADAGAEVVGIDRSGEMIASARETYPDRSFARADARALPVSGGFDAVFSNATLHWVDADDQSTVLAEVADMLRPEGRLVVELGGAGNVSAIVDPVVAEAADRGYETTNPWFFPTIGEYATLLEAAGFEVHYARLFDRPTELEDGEQGLATWLDAFGGELLAPVPPAERDDLVAAVEDRLRDQLFADGAWTADYRRLRVVAVPKK